MKSGEHDTLVDVYMWVCVRVCNMFVRLHGVYLLRRLKQPSAGSCFEGDLRSRFHLVCCWVWLTTCPSWFNVGLHGFTSDEWFCQRLPWFVHIWLPVDFPVTLVARSIRPVPGALAGDWYVVGARWGNALTCSQFRVSMIIHHDWFSNYWTVCYPQWEELELCWSW